MERKKATELLCFILSNTNRQHDPEKPNQIPVAFALKGYSLMSDKLSQMIEDVRNKCNDHGITVVADCTDGQWTNITTRSIDGKPLTHLQFQKDCWSKNNRQSKAKLLDRITKYSKVEPEDLENISTLLLSKNQDVEVGNIQVSNANGKLYVQSTGDTDKKIPLIGKVQTTNRPSAWLPKGKKKVFKQI